MLLRNRLKKELVNLLMLKNKKILCLLFVLTLLFMLPEDKELSSGNSNVRARMAGINNYDNVSNYEYKSEENNESDILVTQLKDEMYAFKEDIEFLIGEEFPQGLCITDEYVLISSYSEEKNEFGKIRVYDRETGDCLLTLLLDSFSHVGGLAFDGRYIWICNSYNMSLERLSYSFLNKMIEDNRECEVDARSIVDVFRVENKPSSVTYYDGLLWVATHSVLSDSKMIAYELDERKNRLNARIETWIPSKVQGVAFSEDGEVYFSISYGRKNSSYVKKYASIASMSNKFDSYIQCIELPPCSEEIVCFEDNLYVIFESAATKFLYGTDGKGQCYFPIDKILIIQR